MGPASISRRKEYTAIWLTFKNGLRRDPDPWTKLLTGNEIKIKYPIAVTCPTYTCYGRKSETCQERV